MPNSGAYCNWRQHIRPFKAQWLLHVLSERVITRSARLVYTRPNYTSRQDDVQTRTEEMSFVFAARTETRRIGTSVSRDRPNYTNLLHVTLHARLA
jgi:hypothetical protein